VECLGAKIPTNVPKSQQWLCWWAKKSTQLVYYPMNEFDLEEEALVLTTNFVDNVHSSMGFIFEGENTLQ
jgi:hypothetical protein